MCEDVEVELFWRFFGSKYDTDDLSFFLHGWSKALRTLPRTLPRTLLRTLLRILLRTFLHTLLRTLLATPLLRPRR